MWIANSQLLVKSFVQTLGHPLQPSLAIQEFKPTKLLCHCIIRDCQPLQILRYHQYALQTLKVSLQEVAIDDEVHFLQAGEPLVGWDKRFSEPPSREES